MSLVYSTKCDDCKRIRADDEDGWAHDYNGERDYCPECLAKGAMGRMGRRIDLTHPHVWSDEDK